MQNRGKFQIDNLAVGSLVVQKNDVNIHTIVEGTKTIPIFIARHIAEWGDKGTWPETQEQITLCNLMRTAKLVHHSVPNSGARDALTARTLKREGLSPGVPDLYIIDTPTIENVLGGRPLAIEMKRRNGSLSDVDEKQLRWLKHLGNNGWCAVIAYGYAAAVQAIGLAGYDLSHTTNILYETIASG